MNAIKETSSAVATSDGEHQQHTKPTQRIRLLHKGRGARKGYLYACVEHGNDDRFHLGFSLCHDDKFNGVVGIEIAKKRAARNSKLQRFMISKYIEPRHSNNAVVIPESIVDDMVLFIDYCKGVFELKPPLWADGFGLYDVPTINDVYEAI